jgi:hypothetical protein
MDLNKLFLIAMFIGTGGIFFGIGLFFLVTTIGFLRKSVRAQGTVVGYKEETSRSKEGPTTMYYPTVEFEDARGWKQSVTLSFGSITKDFGEGYPFTILFDPENPTRVRIATFGHLWLFPLVFGCFGIILLAIGFLIWIFLPISS